jgi:hypothetical protein
MLNNKGQRPLKMRPIGCPETPLTNHQYTWHKIPEEQRSQMKVSRDCSVNPRIGPEKMKLESKEVQQ